MLKIRTLIVLVVLAGSTVLVPRSLGQNQPAHSEEPWRAEMFGGYSYEHVAICGHTPGGCGLESGNLAALPENFHGWNTAFTFYFSNNLGLTADFSGHYITQHPVGSAGVSFSRYSYRFGPTFPIYGGKWDKASLFGHALFGAVHQNIFNTTGFSSALGGGLDVKAARHVWIRAVQADYELIAVPKTTATSKSGFTHGFRYAGGIVLR